MAPIRTFQSRLFLTLLLVAVVPTAVAVLSGTFAMRELVRIGGTAGPWDAVGESGAALLELVEAEGDPELQAAAERHRAELSESLRLSRLYAFVATRFLEVLPLFALALGALGAVLAFAAARVLSRQLSAPVEELVDWAGRIGRREPLPPAAEDRGVREFQRLRTALREMDAELTRARKSEEERIRMRSWTETARRVAHELKNPLTPMRMAADRILRRGDERTKEAGTVLLEEIDRLDELARSFSNFGRAPEGPTSEVDLTELLEGLARRHADSAVRVEVAANGDLPRTRAHADALERVFRNLLANALEATGPRTPGAPAVRIRAASEAGGITVRVRDHGPGIPPEQLERIWDPEFTTKRRGTGLGLALVRKTVEAYGGRVEARNHPEGGAEFTVRLPAGEPVAPPGHAPG